MCDPCPLNHPQALQLDRFNPQVLEHSDALAQQDVCQVDIELVEQSGS